jgi:hypothetical protein
MPERSPTLGGNLTFAIFPSPNTSTAVWNWRFRHFPRTIDSSFRHTLHDRLDSSHCAAATDTMLQRITTKPHCRSWQRQLLRTFSSTVNTPTLPLSGTRVLDLTRVLAGVRFPSGLSVGSPQKVAFGIDHVIM